MAFFDLFHIGHLNLLERSKEMCDFLIVGVCDDNYVRDIKHKEPVVLLEDRIRILKALKCVDDAIPGLFIEKSSRFTSKLSDLIGDNVDIWDRLLIESYNMDMAKGIINSSTMANIISCVRYEENEENTIAPQELLDKGIHFISYPWYCTKKHPGELEKYSQAGITVFSRTKDNINVSKLRKAGVNVNILAQHYDGVRVIYQYPLYIMSYIKRVLAKIYIKYKY